MFAFYILATLPLRQHAPHTHLTILAITYRLTPATA